MRSASDSSIKRTAADVSGGVYSKNHTAPPPPHSTCFLKSVKPRSQLPMRSATISAYEVLPQYAKDVRGIRHAYPSLQKTFLTKILPVISLTLAPPIEMIELVSSSKRSCMRSSIAFASNVLNQSVLKTVATLKRREGRLDGRNLANLSIVLPTRKSGIQESPETANRGCRDFLRTIEVLSKKTGERDSA